MTNDHLKIVRYLSLTVGVLPIKMESTNFQKIYKLFSYTTTLIIALFITNEIINLAVLHSKGKIDKMYEIISILILVITSIIKNFVLCRSKNFKNIMKFIEKTDKEFTKNPEMETYQSYMKLAHFSAIFHMFINLTTFALYILRPVLQRMEYGENWTKYNLDDCLLFSLWYPFKTAKYYESFFYFNIILSVISYIHVTFSGIVLYTVVIFLNGQVKILQRQLLDIGNLKDLPETQQISCTIDVMKRHKGLIYISKQLNDNWKWFILFDFCLQSAKVATATIQIFSTKGTLEFLQMLMLFATVTSDLFLTYFYADRLLTESGYGLSMSAFHGDWYELCPKVKKMIYMLMVRTREPMAIMIGPFYVMTNTVLITIFKGVYTYLCFMQQNM